MVYGYDLKPGDLYTNAISHPKIYLAFFQKNGKSYEQANSAFDENTRLMFVETIKSFRKKQNEYFLFYSLKHNAYVMFHLDTLDMIQKI